MRATIVSLRRCEFMKKKSGLFVALAFILLSAIVGGAVNRWHTLGGGVGGGAVVLARGSGGDAESRLLDTFATNGNDEDGGTAVESAYREAMDVVAASYVGDVDYERANQGSIQGMLTSLDPHSSFFPHAEFQKLKEEQNSQFAGIGVTILRHRDGVYVQSAVEGTPAARAGLRYGDRIVEVDNKDAREWTSAEVSKNVRGKLGAPVTLKVERAGSNMPLYVTIVRGSVPLPSIRLAYMIRPGTGYVGMTGGFTHTTDEELRFAIDDLQKQGMRSLVLDLRNNPGGLLDKAISVSSQLLPRGATVVSVRGRDEDTAKIYKNTSGSPEDFPLVVLINRNSASASEIVAGAIQDHGRGLVVGETSFGKGLVQRVYPLPFGNGLTLTTAKYYTPYGRLIQRDYSHVSLYDYYTRHAPDAAASPPLPTPATPNQPTLSVRPNGNETAPPPAPSPEPPTGPPVQTAGGRVFYGGGGITPDITVAPLDPTAPHRTRIFDAAFYFVRDLTAGQVVGFENYRLTNQRVEQLPVTDRLIARFREFVRERQDDNLTPAQADSDADYVRLRLGEEIATAAEGSEAATRVLLEHDPQLLRALEAMPQAKQLAESVRVGASIG